MGLNVYFCDVCGVRVTDVDLRSGHGMLRGHDVICATCLDMGHGKEWLASRGVPAEAAVHAAANGSAPRSTSSAAVLDHARDRAATVEDEATEVRSPIDHEDTHSVRVQDADFAGAAAGFAALGAPERKETDDADGALEEESSDEVDPALLKPATDSVRATDEQPSVVADDVADDESSALVSVKDRASAKARGRSDRLRRSVSGARPGAPAAKAATKKTSSSSVQTPKSSGSGKIAKPKSSTTRSGRKASGGGGGMPLPLKISLITVPLLLILAAAMVGGGVVGRAPREADVKDMPAQKASVEKSYKETLAAVNAAVGSKDLGTLQRAQAGWLKLNEDFATFERNAKTYSNWSEDDCANYRETLRMPDLGSRMKLIRDEIAKQSVK